MIVDCHTHLFPKEVRLEREKFFTGEPAFELLYRSSKSRLVGADDIIQAMDENKVDKSVIFGFPWKSFETAQINNDYVIEAVARYPERLIGLCCVSPADPKSAREVERCLNQGLAGAGELAFYESGIDAEALNSLEPIMALCLQKKAPVLVHTNEPVGHQYPGKSPNTLAQIYALIKQYPENIIVLAHWGGGLFFYCLLKKEVKQSLSNVYVDTAATPFLYDPYIYEVAKNTIGIDKVLFGSDFPLIKPLRYFQELKNTRLSEEDIRLVCGGNALKLFSR